jgi:hypothetical protein
MMCVDAWTHDYWMCVDQHRGADINIQRTEIQTETHTYR